MTTQSLPPKAEPMTTKPTAPASRSGPDQPAAPARLANDAGSGTVLMLSLITVAALLAGFAAIAGNAVITRHRAQAAADLTALAGAVAAATGQDGCATAARVSAANQGRLLACSAVAQAVQVRLSVTSPTGHTAQALARAGPEP